MYYDKKNKKKNFLQITKVMKTDIIKNPFLPVYMIFIVTGMVDATGPMVSLAKESFHISNFLASLLPMLGFLMFGLISIPVSLLQDKNGKKYILKMGLAISLVGLIIPICSGIYGNVIINTGSLIQFYTILISILLLGAGAAILHVSGNPIMCNISEEGQFSKNLSMGHFFNTIGSSLGFLLPIILFHAFALDWSALFPIFAGLVLINLILLNSVHIVEDRKINTTPATFSSWHKLLKNWYVLMMVLGIFIYCGVEISMSSFIPTLLKEKYMISIEKIGLGIIWLLFYLPILIGRFFGSLIMSKTTPRSLLLASTIVALFGNTLIFQNNFSITLIGIFLAGLGFANICPLIFSITIEQMPEHTNELSGLMISAITGAAFIPPIMGLVADGTSIQASFIVPMLCISFLLALALINNRKVKKKNLRF